MKTPWGDATQLRARKLRPGGGHSRAQTERNQRERLFAAMTATVAEKGYEATTVADLVNLSAVSRSSFYSHFEDKQACFLAAVDALTGPALERLAEDEAAVADPESARRGFLALIEAIAAQPAAAKMCLVEIYAAGPEAVALLDRIVDGLAALAARMYDRIPGRQGMPPELVRGMVGGVQKAVYKRLLRGEEAELPGLAPRLWDWMLCVPPPPGPLKPARRRSVRPRKFEERQAASNPPDRVLRALAAVVSEKGYQAATVADVVERAHTSQRTFYESFADKEAAMVAALDSGSAQMLAAALPAFRRARDWAHSVHDTQEAMFRFAAEEPEYGRLGAVEMYAAGKRALEQRETVTESMEALLTVGFELAPDTPPIAPEAIGGALYALLYDFVKDKGPERLPELVPAAVYVTLAPFLGAEDAYAIAVG
ncbi:MAG TPA: TetR/AcrR family transcriptional regulator [Solirubrobacterales bacterium]|nr:TetR/AcrR family transcriptional regulator [Solirubrobacterales bacterium]